MTPALLTVYVSIGNSDNRLTQHLWSLFVDDVDQTIEGSGVGQIHGAWFSLPTSEYQNACWCREIHEDDLDDLRRALAILAGDYDQDSIALAVVARTEFLKPEEVLANV